MSEARTCRDCGREKPLDEYHVAEGYRRHSCRACVNSRRRARKRERRPDRAANDAAVRKYRETTMGRLAAARVHHLGRIKHHATRLAEVELEIAKIRARETAGREAI